MPQVKKEKVTTILSPMEAHYLTGVHPPSFLGEQHNAVVPLGIIWYVNSIKNHVSYSQSVLFPEKNDSLSKASCHLKLIRIWGTKSNRRNKTINKAFCMSTYCLFHTYHFAAVLYTDIQKWTFLTICPWSGANKSTLLCWCLSYSSN